MFNFFKLIKTKEDNAIHLYNTLSRKKEVFVPIKAGKVSFYQCGPTVYWTQHIGNMRAMVMADFIDRTFKYLGYDVKFVRNYTDVGHLTSDSDTGEDKMIRASNRENLSPDKIAEKYIKVFEEDVKELNTLPPSFKPKATEYINEIIDMVQIMLNKDFAYSTDLAIYFDVTRAKDYTKLSGQHLEENITGAGSANVEDPNKKNPADFAIWFFRAGTHKNAIQYWKSPFKSPLVKDGEGFPGWHIECSAMIRKLLGKTIDIHMGGIEHVPVHHTNEIAQSEAVNGVPLADYWIHNEWLVTNSEKMSKSEGTSLSLADIKVKGFSPLALRFFFMQAHYRSRQNFTWEALEAAQKGYANLLIHLEDLGDKIGNINLDFKNKFSEKIADDFNLSQALAVVFELLKSDILNADKLATIFDFDEVLGLDLKKLFFDFKKDIPAEVKNLADEREITRKDKDWSKSDELRDKIKDLGYEVKDTPEGQQIIKA
ncbi:MAG: cysteine--tRNA ligase [Candidatus Paceibacterota bacterium]|jgi:cysteinyl-tRNA synthetase